MNSKSNADLNILKEFYYMVPDEEVSWWIFPRGGKSLKQQELFPQDMFLTDGY